MRSMTGYGSSSFHDRQVGIDVEIRSVNHRFFSFKASLPDDFSGAAGELERIVRRKISRGSVNLTISMSSASPSDVPLPDAALLKNVYHRLKATQRRLKIPGEITMGSLLTLPWIANNSILPYRDVGRLWPKICSAVEQALNQLTAMRVREGAGISKDLKDRLNQIERCLEDISERAPQVLAAYQRKLNERVKNLVGQYGLEIAKTDLLKEIAVFADRSDISEEVQRLKSHILQFRKILKLSGQVGRRLDFLTQELLRETNTLAAKGSDSGISSHAVEIKAEIEKIKEQTENVE